MGLRPLVLPGVLVVAWLLFSIPGGLTVVDLLAGLAAAGAGVIGGALWPRLHAGAERVVAIADDLLGEGDPAPGGGGGDGQPGDPDALEAAAVPAAMETLLDQLADWLRATRLLLWRVDREADEVVAEHGAGKLPAALPAAGNPLAWVLDQRSPVRLDPAPRWARGAAVVVPVDDMRVLTVETPAGEPAPAAAALSHTASVLAPFLRLHDQQDHAAAATRRLDRVVEYLRSVPREADPGRMPESLALTALELIDGAGAAVASWTPDVSTGRVLVRVGGGGGPRPGTPFDAMDGDLAHAARTATTIARAPADPRWPPLAVSTEGWDRPPPAYRTVVPLVDPRGEPAGLLAVWGRTPPAAQGLALLEAIAPLFALQLRQADDLVHFRDRATIDRLTRLPNRAALEDRMAEEDARFHRYRRPVALVVVDLDYFKGINDTHGHEAGDAVLRRVAEIVDATVRDADFVARFGGEEIVIVLPETMLRAAVDVAERVRHAVELAQLEFDGRPLPVTASLGVSACPECVEEPESLFASADQALYVAKEAGRNRVTAAPVRVASGDKGDSPSP